MKNDNLKFLKICTVVSALVAMGLGVLLHYAYEWSGENVIVGMFSPVNESIWEHLKLIFFPILLLSFVEYGIYGRKYPNYFCSKLLGVLSGMGITVLLYYTITGIIGKDVMFVNILIFIVSVFLAYGLSLYKLLTRDSDMNYTKSEIAASLVLTFVAALFFVFTFIPPEIGIFIDSTTGLRGI